MQRAQHLAQHHVPRVGVAQLLRVEPAQKGVECTAHLSATLWTSMDILRQILGVVQTNLFRSLPDSCLVVEFAGVDVAPAYSLPSWLHVQCVYELLFQALLNKDIEGGEAMLSARLPGTAGAAVPLGVLGRGGLRQAGGALAVQRLGGSARRDPRGAVAVLLRLHLRRPRHVRRHQVDPRIHSER